MKRLLVAGISIAALGAASAFAADVNVPSLSDPLADFPIVYQIPPVRVFTWTGCYLGIHAGGAFVDNQFNGQFLIPSSRRHPALQRSVPSVPMASMLVRQACWAALKRAAIFSSRNTGS